jgi:thiamine transporter
VNQTNQENRQFFSTKILAEIIVLVSLAGALSLISHSFFRLPQGGSINLGMIPIFWLALRRGWIIGIFAGAVFGVVDMTIEPFIVNPIQFILDYPLAFAVLGVAGLFRKYAVVGVAFGGIARFSCHFISGIVYFADYAPAELGPVIYSAVYNGTYIIPSIIICAIIIGILQKSKTLNIYL